MASVGAHFLQGLHRCEEQTPALAHRGESLCQEPSPALLPRQEEVDPFPWRISSAPALQKNRPTRLCLCVRALSEVLCFWADPLSSVSILLSSLLSTVPLYGHIFLPSVHLLRDMGQLPVSALIRKRCLAILFFAPPPLLPWLSWNSL